MSFKLPSSSTLRPALLAAGLMGIAAVGGVFAAGGDAGGPPKDRGDRPAWRGEHRNPADRMAEELQLDDAQKASVKAIFERNRPVHEKLRERGKAHWEAMKSLKPGSPNYSSRAQALADEAGTLARDRTLARTQLDAELATVLTPAQLEKFQQRKVRGFRGRGGDRDGRPHRDHRPDGDGPPEGGGEGPGQEG